MADAVLCDEILITLGEKEAITVQSPSDFAMAVGLNPAWSNRQVKRALGSLITRGNVLRVRRPLQYLGDTGGPTTYRFVRS